MVVSAPMCETCGGTGFVPRNPTRGERVSLCECRRTRTKTAPGVPIDLADAAFETFERTKDNEHAIEFVPKWLNSDGGRDLYIAGPVGTGKTRIACSLLNEAQRTGTSCQFWRVPMFLLRLQPTDVEHHELFLRACEVDLLVLDDLGAERESANDYTRRTLLILYEERFDHGRRTIWTSNKSLVEIGEFMQDERLVSRIKGRADILEIDGDDWRMSRRRRR